MYVDIYMRSGDKWNWDRWVAGDWQSICQKQIKTFGSIIRNRKIQNYITGPVVKHSGLSRHFLQYLSKNVGLAI
jgi:hypothetical protein